MALPASEMMIQSTIGWILVSFLISIVVVRGSIGYAHRRGMLDRPGHRRSHVTATPRGGGIGIVLAMIFCLPGVLWGTWPTGVVAGLVASLALVAGAGWWDDHRSLAVLPRLAAQLVGVALFSVLLLEGSLSLWWLPLLLFGGVWSINLHNFMDGIDGMLAVQTMFVACGLALLSVFAQQSAVAIASASLALAAFAFWCYNRSPARIFMGDVGSGSVGLLIFALSAMLWRIEHALLWPALILSSSFIVDASLTLLGRIRAGRRWYAPHREHLYQWQVRGGMPHSRVVAGYFGWNLFFVLPLTWLACSHLSWALATTIVAYVCAIALWLLLKRRCLKNPLRKDRHVAS
jgi:UDP-N-acetylmuramyl pentapeptide phosphotransferase/UDP-N-acetylglucosamine-1-phosphate transferase